MGAKFDKVRKKLGKGQAWGKNCNNIFVPTALTTIGKYKMRATL
jgi:hypothetical protein